MLHPLLGQRQLLFVSHPLLSELHLRLPVCQLELHQLVMFVLRPLLLYLR